LLFLACLAGCGSRETAAPEQGHAHSAALEIVVVDDAGLARAIDALRAEWKARSGGNLSVVQKSSAEVVAESASLGHADAVIYPSSQLGALAEGKLIVPLPADYQTNEELAWSDTFELVQIAETRWCQEPWAVSFGPALLTCYYRADLFEKFRKRPPRTWAEYHELAAFFAKRENLAGFDPPENWSGTIEPLAPAWKALVLLARAAAYAKHRDHFSTLWKMDSMEPLIAGAPFVRALEEMVADAVAGPNDAASLDPLAAGQRFLEGKAALALAIPTHVAPGASRDQPPPPAIGYAELPGSSQVYNISNSTWEKRPEGESELVPLLGFSGRLGSVTSGSSSPADAFQLLAWLSGREWGATVSRASSATSLYRRSQLVAPQGWVDPLMPLESARQYAEVERDAMTRQAFLFVPRIPGGPRYLEALEAAVGDALAGKKSPADALGHCADEWRKITAELGVESQAAAYRCSLGLER
jgi:ABC-type glycerol-3-phosphate transport system substrate-binding protein